MKFKKKKNLGRPIFHYCTEASVQLQTGNAINAWAN